MFCAMMKSDVSRQSSICGCAQTLCWCALRRAQPSLPFPFFPFPFRPVPLFTLPLPSLSLLFLPVSPALPILPSPRSRRRRREREAEKAVTYVFYTARPWAQLRASPADRPQSEQIWCSQVMGGRPRDLRQFAKGGTRSRTSHATRRTALAYAQRGRTVRDGGGEQSTGYSADPIWCRLRHL